MTTLENLKVGQKFAIRGVGTVEIVSKQIHHGFGTVKLHYKRDDGVVFSATLDAQMQVQVLP